MSRNKLVSFLLLWFCALHLVICANLFAQRQFIYEEKGKRNPFIPLVTSDGRILSLDQEAQSELRLEGIIYDKISGSYAIVNQAIVRVGDWVGDYQIFKIEESKVIFLKNGQATEVEFKKEE